jgi:hypothetical protein
MNPRNREALEMATGHFNTIWRNIAPERFFQCGFELFKKNFTYTKFFDRRILRLYIERDKIIKREWDLNLIGIKKSIEFIKGYMRIRPHREDLSMIKQYCLFREGESMPIRHFIENNIDKFTVSWLIGKHYLVLTDEERMVVPLIVQNYNLYHTKLYSQPDIVKWLEEELNK